MKLFIVFLLLYISACSPNEKSNPNIDTAKEAELLKKLEYDALVAEFKLDTASIASILHERFSYIGVHEVTGKQQELTGIYNNISQRLKEGHTIDSFYIDQFKAEFFGNTAILSFFTVTKGMNRTIPYENKKTRFYDVWIKENGSWKLVSMQATPLLEN